MTFRNKWLSYIKFSVALVLLLWFIVVIAYADKFKKWTEVVYVNTSNFVQSNNNESAAINLDMVAYEVWTDNEWVITYIVQPWDTLSKIASAFWTTVAHIKKINWITKPLQVNQKLIITSEENWLIYTIPEKTNILVFANKYSLDIEDLMTLNYIQDESEILQEWQEVFLPITLETAYNVWLMERPKPVYKPKTTVTYTPTISKPATTSTKTSGGSSNAYAGSSILSTWIFNKNINNKFYAWHCTWYVAATTPQIFPYINENTQARPFGWNANQWYDNARAAWFSVWQTPVVWSIIVYNKWGGSFASAWHVWKVVSYDASTKKLIIEEMNGSNKFVVQRRTDKADNPNIRGYIYMPATPWTPSN